ncbi:flagellar biosynthetic protein FliQ [Rhodobacteraceae bacterium]|nr:flagellar biosynthetic protein FliQ [Paracoccaceae bacterium]
MTQDALFDVMREALVLATRISLPILAIALIVGLFIGLFQALTSVQEMTLTFVPKLGAILVVFWLSMDFMTNGLVEFFTLRIIPLIIGA